MDKVNYVGKVKEYVEAYDGIKQSIWSDNSAEILAARAYIRKHYLTEQDFRCAYCRIQKKEKHGMTWDVEHILPKSLYPEFLFEPENLAVACKECNGSKDNQEILTKKLGKARNYPRSSDEFKIVHPHYDKLSDHIEISVVEGRRRYRVLNNEKGRNTYIACNFFRFDFEFGEWESFDDAIVNYLSGFLDRCHKDDTPQDVKRQLSHIQFVINCDF
jgi:uncharacterized protein (TIGR02646 family)